MLTCTVDTQKKLHIKFDIPMPEACLSKEQARGFLDAVQALDGAEIGYSDKGDLIGLSLTFSGIERIADTFLVPRDAGIQKETFAAILRQTPPDKKTGLEINFHQNPYDTPERYWNFILNQGHFAAFFFNRLNWYLGPKKEYVTDFPLHVDIESASTCNMNCAMCYRDGLKHTGQMAWDVFTKVVDECARHNVFSVRLSWRGETLTHPRIKEMIAYATSRIKNVSFLTNAFYIDDGMIDCFITEKVNYIAVSFDGIGDTYEKIRHPAKFRENYNRLLGLKQEKAKRKSRLPQVRLCTIWPAISENPEEYYDTMKEVSDYIVCNPYINFAGPMEIKEDFICQYPWERIVIGYNGDTQCCTGWNADDIILGNVKDTTIHDMWKSPLMEKIRATHARGNRMELNSCTNCRHGSKGDPGISIETILERKY